MNWFQQFPDAKIFIRNFSPHGIPGGFNYVLRTIIFLARGLHRFYLLGTIYSRIRTQTFCMSDHTKATSDLTKPARQTNH